MYKMKSGLGQGGWVIDDSGKVTTLEQVNNIEFGQNTLGRIILKAIRCVQHRKSDTEDSAFFDENAVGWVHDALFNAREAGLQMVAHESDFVSGGRSLVRDHFSECSLSLKDFASIRGLIFDLDNTLFRTGGAISSIEPLVFAVGEHYAVADMDVLRDRLWKESVDRIISGLQLRPGKSETDAKEAIWAAYGVLEVRNPIPMLEGWGELKDLLNSSKVDRALLSSGVWSLQARKIEAAIGVQQIFHPIIIDDARSALGKRRLMEAILEEWGYEPRQVLVVGDDREAEMVFGQELGCRLAHVCSGGGCECDLEFCLNDLAELVDMLKSRIYF
jgi:FMN phosphatase YigB (HAD superfamily)